MDIENCEGCRDLLRRYHEAKRARDNLATELTQSKEKIDRLQRTSQAAADRQKKREDQLDLIEGVEAVDLWRQRYQEQGRKLHTAQSDLSGARQRIEEVQTLNAVLNRHLKGALKDLEQAQSDASFWLEDASAARSRKDAAEREAEEARAENMQLQAALLGARERIRRAERAAEERVRAAEQKLKEMESRASTSPPSAPEEWRHSITVGEHLRELAELRRHFEQRLAGVAA